MELQHTVCAVQAPREGTSVVSPNWRQQWNTARCLLSWLLIDLPRPHALAIHLDARLICQQGQHDVARCNTVGSRLGKGCAACGMLPSSSTDLCAVFSRFQQFSAVFQPVNKYKCCLPLGTVESHTQSITVTARWRCHLQFTVV